MQKATRNGFGSQKPAGSQHEDALAGKLRAEQPRRKVQRPEQSPQPSFGPKLGDFQGQIH